METKLIDSLRIDGYRWFNFAILTSRGLDQVFNILRYERAFLANPADVAEVQRAMTSEAMCLIPQEFKLLLAKYDWGKRGNWHYDILLSGQSLEEIDTVRVITEFHVEIHKPTSSLKWCNVMEVTGTIQEVLDQMRLNRACPNREDDAHIIEGVIYSPGEIVTVQLCNYTAAEKQWRNR